MQALRDIRNELRLGMLSYIWIGTLLATYLLVATAAPTAVVALVFGGIGAAIVATVPRTRLWRMAARSELDEARMRAQALANAARLARAELEHQLATHQLSTEEADLIGAFLSSPARRSTIRARSLRIRLAEAMVRSAARQLPASERSRWLEEWFAELYDMRRRGGLALTWGLGVRLTAYALAAELRGDIARDEAHEVEPRVETRR